MTATTPALPDGVHAVREPRTRVGAIPMYPVPAWTAAFPWLVHGTTGAVAGDGDAPRSHDDGSPADGATSAAGGGPRPQPDGTTGVDGMGTSEGAENADGSADLGLFEGAPVGRVLGRWRGLREGLGVPRAVHSEQVHGARMIEHLDRLPGLFIARGYDGHVTGMPGILLTVSVADCVPISLVDPKLRRITLLHAGWRGTASGIVESGLDAIGGVPDRIHAHLGPAICGECYEVGPEVHDGLGLPVPETNTPVDLRAVQAGRLVEGGVAPDHITVSAHCTKHDPGFFSHRGGSVGRQVGVLGVRKR